jgi:ABC-2 type transport system ATP-binding protein
VIGDYEIRDAMRRVGLEPALRQKVRHYSLGMKQKLGLAQAIMEDPEVLLLDEPFNALDNDSVLRVREMMRELRDAGKTLVFTSHNADDIAELSEATFVIDRQQIHPA